jgi:hypothetical protein
LSGDNDRKSSTLSSWETTSYEMCNKTSGERCSSSRSSGEQSRSLETPSNVCSTRPVGATVGERESGDEGDPRAPVLTGAASPITAKACVTPCRVGTVSTTKDTEAYTGEAKAVVTKRGGGVAVEAGAQES